MSTYSIARVPFPATPAPVGYDAAWVTRQMGNIARAIPSHDRQVTASTTMLTTDDLSVVYCDATTAPVVYTLLPAGQAQFIKVWLVQVDNSGNSVTLGGVVSGVTNPTLGGQYKAMLVSSDGTAYYKLGAV